MHAHRIIVELKNKKNKKTEKNKKKKTYTLINNETIFRKVLPLHQAGILLKLNENNSLHYTKQHFRAT